MRTKARISGDTLQLTDRKPADVTLNKMEALWVEAKEMEKKSQSAKRTLLSFRGGHYAEP
ncbi:MAG: hypothetical protein R3C60_11265 [Parvularculaceae bacterium]